MMSPEVNKANQMLYNLPTKSGKYFLSAMAFTSIAPRDAQSIQQTGRAQTPSQQVMINSLNDIGQNVSLDDKHVINTYLRNPQVHQQLENKTLLKDLSKTKLPASYQKILQPIPHRTSAQILHDFYARNITRQNDKQPMTTNQHQRYQSIINEGTQLGSHLTPNGLNYFKQSLRIYHQHPLLLAGIKAQNLDNLSEDDLRAGESLQQTAYGETGQGNNARTVQPPISKQEKFQVDNYIQTAPKAIIDTNDLPKILNHVDEQPNHYVQPDLQFQQQFSAMSYQEQQGYRYLIKESYKHYPETRQAITGEGINTSPIAQKEQKYMGHLINGQTSTGKQVYPALNMNQQKRMLDFFINPEHQSKLRAGNYNQAISNYDYGDSSINGLVHKALGGDQETRLHKNKALRQIMKRYYQLDVQSQKYMQAIAKSYTYNPMSFERQYIANMSQDSHMKGALSASERSNWKRLQNISNGIVKTRDGQMIKTGRTAQHKLDVNYLISQPQNRSLFRNGAVVQAITKDTQVDALARNNPQQLSLEAQVARTPYSNYGTLNTHKYLQSKTSQIPTAPQQTSGLQIHSHQHR